MLMVISPAKTLDFSVPDYPKFTQPAVLEQSQKLVEELRTYEPAQISSLMKISDQLADLNYERFQAFQTPFTPENAKQALLVFKGDVYKGIKAEEYNDKDLAFAQRHLRILSGLYGILRPLDLMQPYRLEMGTKLKTQRGKNLYEFWGDQISQLLDADFAAHKTRCLINLASNEYFKSVDLKALQARVINIVFKENRGGAYKVIAFNAKRARGLMVDYAVRNRIKVPKQLKHFDTEGYAFNDALSDADNWIFCRG
ncbi:MAG: peroxide stress protein YaaA [Gammaproteobacteria bacterium]|nr:peroxide stress protein YaaA [Gammaproteobacteria bacterium]